jgi:hypothetical protein
MIICPSCHHQEISGTLFCSECGTQLAGEDGLITKAFQPENAKGIKKSALAQTSTPKSDVSHAATSWLSLHIMESGQILPLADRSEFTLGRVSEGQPIMPDIDLSAYQAYTNGVSRLHAVLKRSRQQVIIMDLGSSNGTYLNGKKLETNIETPIKHGDVIALGKLKIQVLFKNS